MRSPKFVKYDFLFLVSFKILNAIGNDVSLYCNEQLNTGICCVRPSVERRREVSNMLQSFSCFFRTGMAYPNTNYMFIIV